MSVDNRSKGSQAVQVLTFESRRDVAGMDDLGRNDALVLCEGQVADAQPAQHLLALLCVLVPFGPLRVHLGHKVLEGIVEGDLESGFEACTGASPVSMRTCDRANSATGGAMSDAQCAPGDALAICGNLLVADGHAWWLSQGRCGLRAERKKLACWSTFGLPSASVPLVDRPRRHTPNRGM
jgi:hypothetical protein